MGNDKLIMMNDISGIMHNVRVKSFPNGAQEVLCASEAVFREPGWETHEKWSPSIRGASGGSDAAANLFRAQRRARMAIRDIALSNDFKYFITFTLDASTVDRYDIKAQTKRMNSWLDNRVRRHGLKYVLVPELHKDGAIHYHGFVNDALCVVDSGTVQVQGGRPKRPRSGAERRRLLADGAHAVYNVPEWRYGFSTAIEIYGDYSKAVAYVCKYISKQPEKIGGRWYYSGGDLVKPDVSFSDVDINAFIWENGKDITFSRAGIDFVSVMLGGADE